MSTQLNTGLSDRLKASFADTIQTFLNMTPEEKSAVAAHVATKIKPYSQTINRLEHALQAHRAKHPGMPFDKTLIAIHTMFLLGDIDAAVASCNDAMNIAHDFFKERITSFDISPVKRLFHLLDAHQALLDVQPASGLRTLIAMATGQVEEVAYEPLPELEISL